MKKRIFIFIFLVLSLLCLTTMAEEQDMMQEINIAGVNVAYKLTMSQGDLYIASNVSEDAFILLQERGIKFILNLQLPGEQEFDEEQAAKKHGIQYFSLPIEPQTLNEKTVKAFNAFVSNKENYPLYIHCSSANRVAMMMALYNITEQNIPVEEAISDAQQYGLTNSKLIKIIRDYAKEKVIIKK